MPEVIVYFDTCIFIELLQKQNKKRFDACEELRAKGEKGELTIVTSSVTIAETIKLDKDKPATETESKMILELFEHPYFNIRQCDRFVSENAHTLSVKYGVTALDGIHLATAISVGASALYTYDGETKKRRGKLIPLNGKVGSPPLTIIVPPNPNKGTLLEFLDDEKADTIQFKEKKPKLA